MFAAACVEAEVVANEAERAEAARMEAERFVEEADAARSQAEAVEAAVAAEKAGKEEGKLVLVPRMLVMSDVRSCAR